MCSVGHDTAVVEPRKGPLRAGNNALRRIFVLLLGEHRVRVVQVVRRVRAVDAVSEELHRCGRIWLKDHHQLAGERAVGRDRLGGAQAHETRGIRHVVLPATPGHRIPLTHQEAIARIEGFGGGHICGAVEIA